MPKRARSGVPNLYKKHTAACRNREPLKCDCPWYGKYKRINVNLARWSGQYVDPRRRQHAVVVLNRLRDLGHDRRRTAASPGDRGAVERGEVRRREGARLCRHGTAHRSAP